MKEQTFKYSPDRRKRYIRYPIILLIFIFLLRNSELQREFVNAITFKEFNNHSLIIVATLYFAYVTTVELVKFKRITFKDNIFDVPAFKLFSFRELIEVKDIKEIRELRSEVLPGISIIRNSNKNVLIKKNYMVPDDYESLKKLLENATSKKIHIVFDARQNPK